MQGLSWGLRWNSVGFEPLDSSMLARAETEPSQAPGLSGFERAAPHAGVEFTDSCDGSASNDLIAALCDEYLELGRHCRRHWPTTFQGGEEVAGRYLVEKFLARGGMGEVYAAFDRFEQRRVALKTLLSTQADSADALQRLQREAAFAQRVDHPNVCRVFAVGRDTRNPLDVTHFISQELLEGETLRSRLQRQALTAREAHSIIEQVTAAVAATHRAGVLHRDLKTGNVMVCGNDDQIRAVLIDFGLAQPIRRACRVVNSEICGSLGYMAPEQSAGQPATPSTDIFSLGVVIFEILTARAPSRLHSTTEPCSFLDALEQVPFPAGVPPALRQLVLACTRFSPAQRPSSVEAVLASLRAAYAREH